MPHRRNWARPRSPVRAGVADARRPCVYVLAGANGAGKSSIGGAMLLAEGVEYFNPDQAARLILSANPGTTQEHANSAAWHEGRRLLERAIAERRDFAFETTLGGRTITALLEQALSDRMDVRIWFAGLKSPALHIARVRSRVARGGHDIPEATIRDRYNRSRLNLIRLLPKLTELRVYDNSEEADPFTGIAPVPMLILHVARGTIVRSCPLALTPDWAKPIVASAMRCQRAPVQ
ncbi:MAG: zeta toxin family protein [Acidobacteria bacterium]|nr:zeta toxin family protein [Acidobacteriota bacterium]